MKQKQLLNQALKTKEYKRLSQEDVALNRKEFKPNKLRQEWEKQTGQKWPTYTNSKGKTVNYDAHHIIENKYAGPNEWWNIHPARGGVKGTNEHQSGIHLTESSKKLFPDK